MEFPMLSLGSDRAQQLSGFGMYVVHLRISFKLTQLDGFLADVVDRIPSSSKYTIIYTTSPREFPETDSVIYEASGDSYQDSVHMDLKRDYSAHGSASSSLKKHTSLFHEYQYFTPGLCANFIFPLHTLLTYCQVSSWASWLPSYSLQSCTLPSMP
jgi:hypothetical protein